MKLLFNILKNLIFRQTEKDAIEISKAVLKSKKIDELLSTESYFKKKIGETDECLTPEDVIFARCFGKLDAKKEKHLKECVKCYAMYKTVNTGTLIVSDDSEGILSIEKALKDDDFSILTFKEELLQQYYDKIQKVRGINHRGKSKN